MEEMRERFNSMILCIMENKKSNSGFMTKQKYDELLMKVKISKGKKSGKKPEDYQRLKRYDVLKIDNVEKLIVPIRAGNSNIRLYVHYDEIFNIIHETHIGVGHGGRNRMLKELQKRYKNVTAESVMIYLGLCEVCQEKPRGPKKTPTVRPVVFQELDSRCQVDLIDMQFQRDGDFRFIFVYQDDLTKFVQLRPLRSSSIEEVASHLIDIFTIFGAPSVVQSENGREFCDKVVRKACEMWQDLKIVHGNPGHNQIPGSVESPSKDVEIMVNSWLETNKTNRWSEGLRFIQIMKNRAFHDGIKCTPYEAMFGMPYKLGLKTSFPNESIKDLWTEEELQAWIETYNAASDQTNSDVEDDCSVKESDPLQNDYTPTVTIKEENPEMTAGHSFVYKDSEVDQPDILTEQTQRRRHSVEDSSESQPSKMSKVSNLEFSSGEIGDSVTLRVPDADRGKNDPRDLLAVIIEIQNDEFYRLGTAHGRLREWYARNQFSLCEEKFISIQDVPNSEITLRECIRRTVVKFKVPVRCVCKGGCKCDKCRCKKYGKLCNYRCHGGSMCFNSK